MVQKWEYKAIEIRLNPRSLYDQEALNYYKLNLIEDFQTVAVNFDYVMQDILSLSVPSFFKWRARRVEYAVDLFVGEHLLPKYLLLFKKGNIPDYMLQNDDTKKYFHSVTNAYFKATTVTVNWYNRYETLLAKQKKSVKKFVNFDSTKGILRLEIQCRDCKGTIIEVLSAKLCQKEIGYFYNFIVGKGDYYKLDKAKAMISKVQHRDKRLALLRVIELINKCGGIALAKIEFSKGKESIHKAMDEFSKRINQLRKLGINPVCLPPEWDKDKLENLDGMIYECFSKIS